MQTNDLARLLESESLSEAELVAMSPDDLAETRRVMLDALNSHLASRPRLLDSGYPAAGGPRRRERPLVQTGYTGGART